MDLVYKHSVVGGTFDHFHLGHEKLLATACEQSNHITIGIAREVLYQQKELSQIIEPFATRKAHVEAFLQKAGFFDRVKIIPIDDIYGNTLEEEDLQAIFVTEENFPNVEKINAKRKEKGFSELQAVFVPLVMAGDNKPISSDRIRRGEIDRTGFVYEALFAKQLTLPEDLRPQLQRPIGEVYQDIATAQHLLQEKLVIAVGDIVTKSLHEAGITPALSLIDFKSRREELAVQEISLAIHAANPQGTIAPQAVEAMIRAKQQYLETKQPQTIIIDGEEDLLALPAILLAPLDAVVMYGQFDEGVVINHVDQKLKQQIVTLLQEFTH